MGAFKNEKNGTWYVQFRYTDWQGLRQQKLKRGFATKREAQEWERAFLTEKKADVTMPFKTFTELYEKDVRPKLKENTWLTKEHIIKTKILPYGKPIAFELSEENGFVWKGHYEISIDDLANGISREKKSEQAENLIRDCLSNGKYPQQIILKKAQNTGISKRVLDEAKKSLGIISIKDGCQWYWKLPEEKEARNF